jgi:hypothetical protein
MADRMTRRAFVGVGIGTAAAVGVAAWFGRPGQGVPSKQTQEDFLHVSRLVTGVDDLPENLGPTYLEKIDALGLDMSASDFAKKGGGASSLADLEASVLKQPGARETAEHVAAAWWSGTVPTREKTTDVVTYTDAVIWKGMPFAQPSSQCLGATGAWSHPGKLAA